jgi:hypothetical protein
MERQLMISTADSGLGPAEDFDSWLWLRLIIFDSLLWLQLKIKKQLTLAPAEDHNS